MNSVQIKKQFSLKIIDIFLIPILVILCSVTQATEYELTEVTDGIYVHHGKHIHFGDPGHDDIANIGFIVGDHCIAVIDTGGSIKTGQQLHNAIKAISSKPICYVINTHVHFDHVLGNAVFKNNQTQFIGHMNLGSALMDNADYFLEAFSENLESRSAEEVIIPPDIQVENTLEIELGNRKLLITAYPVAHSYTDLSVFDKKTNTLWLSDLLFIERIPALEGSLKGWLTVLETIQSINATHIIPGHGPTNLKWNEALQPQIDYLNLLLTEIRSGIDQGIFMTELIDNVAKEEKQKWTLYKQHHKRNISKAFVELEWE